MFHRMFDIRALKALGACGNRYILAHRTMDLLLLQAVAAATNSYYVQKLLSALDQRGGYAGGSLGCAPALD